MSQATNVLNKIRQHISNGHTLKKALFYTRLQPSVYNKLIQVERESKMQVVPYVQPYSQQIQQQIRNLFDDQMKQSFLALRQQNQSSQEFIKRYVQTNKMQQDSELLKRFIQVYEDEAFEYIDNEYINRSSVFDRSDGVWIMTEELKENIMISDSQRERLTSKLWETFKKRRTGNDNYYKFDEKSTRWYYVPSSCGCFFKCLLKLLPYNSHKIIVQMICEFKSLIKRGISTKKAKTIIKEELYFVNMYDENHKSTKEEALLVLIDNHWCVLQKGLSVEGCKKSIEKIQSYLNECKKQVRFTQDDINNLISREQRQYANEDDSDSDCVIIYKYDKVFNIYVSDVESFQPTNGKQIPFLVGFQKFTEKISDFTSYNFQKLDYQNFEKDPKELITRFLNKIFYDMGQDKKLNSYLYFHNGQNYDNHLILQNLDSKLFQLCNNVQIKGNAIQFSINCLKDGKYKRTIHLLDSNKIFGSSLLKICESMKLQNCKKDSSIVANLTSYDDFVRNKRVILNYFKYDIFSLSEAIHKTRKFFIDSYDIDIIEHNTVGRIAMAIYEKEFNKDYRNQQTWFNNVAQNDLISKFIMGGRVNCYRQQKENDILYYLDANSLYPSSMIEIDEILGGFFMLDKHAKAFSNYECDELKDFLNENYSGIVDESQDYLKKFHYIVCDITIPQGQKVLTNYVRTQDKGCGYYTGSFKQQFLSSWDLIQLMMYNSCRIDAITQVIQLKTKVNMGMGKMMKEFKVLRNNYKQENNEVAQLQIKVIMNSLYGKMIQKAIYEQHMTHKAYSSFKHDDKEIMQRIRVTEEQDICMYIKKDLEQQMNCSNTSVAVQILAMSKIIMNRAIYACNGFNDSIYYTDTDSIIVSKEQYEKLCKCGMIGNEVGQLKLEQKLTDFITLGKKFYCYTNSENHVDCRIKGFPQKRNKHNDELLFPEDVQAMFRQLQKGQKITQSNLHFNRSIIKRSIVVGDQQKELQCTYQNQCTLKDNLYLPKHIDEQL